MSTQERPRPPASDEGTGPTKVGETNTQASSGEPRWTDADLILMWQVGYDYARHGDQVATAIDEMVHASAGPPRTTHEQWVARRHAAMLLSALRGIPNPVNDQPNRFATTTWRGQYPGGPVDYDTGALLGQVAG